MAQARITGVGIGQGEGRETGIIIINHHHQHHHHRVKASSFSGQNVCVWKMDMEKPQKAGRSSSERLKAGVPF
jgi:hypothetical protein